MARPYKHTYYNKSWVMLPYSCSCGAEHRLASFGESRDVYAKQYCDFCKVIFCADCIVSLPEKDDLALSPPCLDCLGEY